MKKNKNESAQKKLFGMPVYWDSKHPFKNLWNSDDDRIILPKGFGVGYTINFHAVFKKLKLIKKNNEKS